MRVLSVVLGIALTLMVPAGAYAQGDWKPGRNVEVIVGTSPGGAADHSARLIQRVLQQMKIASSVTVVNKPGGSYLASFNYLNQHAGDGHYIAISPINLLTNRMIGLSAVSEADVTPLAQLISDYHVFSVRADSTLQTAADVITRLKKDAGSLSIAISPSIGSANHFAAATILKAAGVDIRRLKVVAFASAGESLASVLGGHADLLVSATPSVTPMIAAGKMRALAVTSPTRLGGAFAKTPTWMESGVNAEFSNWRGVVGPAKMTESQVRYWDAVLQRLAQSEEWKADLAKNNQQSTYLGSAESRKFLAAQAAELSEIVAALGLGKGAAR